MKQISYSKYQGESNIQTFFITPCLIFAAESRSHVQFADL